MPYQPKRKKTVDPLGIRKDLEDVQPPKRKRFVKLKWYLYLFFTAAILGYLAPSWISAKSDMFVGLGVLSVIVWGEVSYKFWVKSLINKLKENL